MQLYRGGQFYWWRPGYHRPTASHRQTLSHNLYIYTCKTQTDVQSLIDVQSSNRRPILKYMAVFHFLKSTSNDVTPEEMMEKGQDQIPDERFLMIKMPMYFIVTVEKILLCLQNERLWVMRFVYYNYLTSVVRQSRFYLLLL